MSDKTKIINVMKTFENLSNDEEIKKLFFESNLASTKYYIVIRKAFDTTLGYILTLEKVNIKTGEKSKEVFTNFSTPDELVSQLNICKEKVREVVANISFITGLSNTFDDGKRLTFTFLDKIKVMCAYSNDSDSIYISTHADGISELSTTTKEELGSHILYYYDFEWLADYWKMFDNVKIEEKSTEILSEDRTCIDSSSSKDKDSVNHPAHYNRGNIECIDAMISAFGKEEVIIFCKINAFKYIWRAGQKTSNGIEDIEKATWYLNKGKELVDSCMSR